MSKFVFLNRSDKIIKINFELNYSRWKKELKSYFKETRFALHVFEWYTYNTVNLRLKWNEANWTVEFYRGNVIASINAWNR